MKSARCMKTAFLFLALTLFMGCDSKSDKTGAGAVAPNEKTAAGAPAPGGAGTAAVVPEKDKADARAEGTRLIAQLKAGEFGAIYKESSDAFKQIGPEPQFVSMLEQTRKKTGPLTGFKETGLETGPDKRQIVIYSVEYGNVKSNLRLGFFRSKEGKMELVGLNQKDEVVKNVKQVKK